MIVLKRLTYIVFALTIILSYKTNIFSEDYDNQGKYWGIKGGMLYIDAPSADTVVQALLEGLKKYHEDFGGSEGMETVPFKYGKGCKVRVSLINKIISPDKETVRVSVAIYLFDKFNTKRGGGTYKWDINKNENRWKAEIIALDTTSYY